MPAAKYAEVAKYLLRMGSSDKAAYEVAAQADRLTLADWINLQLRKELKRRKLRRE